METACRRGTTRSRSTGTGAVTVRSATTVTIDPSVMDDKEMLEDLIAAALNDANRRAETTSQERMGALTAGLPLPPGMKLPF